MFIYCNPNPLGKQVGDCVIRALTMVLGTDWDTTYDLICKEGKKLADMPSANTVWASVLRNQGYVCVPLVNTCPNCYTVKDFCKDHQNGQYLLAIGNHVVAVRYGNYYDSWDSGNEVPISYWVREDLLYG